MFVCKVVIQILGIVLSTEMNYQ